MISEQVLEEREEWKPRKSNQSFVLDFVPQEEQGGLNTCVFSEKCFISLSLASCFKERSQEASFLLLTALEST